MNGLFHKIFVYGTLKRGEPNHYWLQNVENGFCKFVTVGKTLEKYPLVIGTRYNIPFLLDYPGKGHNVSGEMYEVDDKMLKNLDLLEEHPKYYVRRLENIKTSNDIIETCWIYFLPQFGNHFLHKENFQIYSSNGSHNLKYCERNVRSPSYDYKKETLE